MLRPPPAETVDGRNLRALRTRANIMAACRALMVGGEFAPPTARVALKAGLAIRTVFEHYKSTEAMHAAALNEETTRRTVLALASDSDVDCLDWPPKLQDALLHAIMTQRSIAADTKRVA